MKKLPTICLIDDEVTLRDVVRRYVEHDGYHVIEIESSEDALILLQQTQVDLILLDIMLPVLDGFTLLRVLQHSSNYQALNADLPIIMLTSRDENRLMLMRDKWLLRKRYIIETINDQLKNQSQIEHSRHRSPMNFVINVLAGVLASIWQPKKPAINWSSHETKALALIS